MKFSQVLHVHVDGREGVGTVGFLVKWRVVQSMLRHAHLSLDVAQRRVVSALPGERRFVLEALHVFFHGFREALVRPESLLGEAAADVVLATLVPVRIRGIVATGVDVRVLLAPLAPTELKTQVCVNILC